MNKIILAVWLILVTLTTIAQYQTRASEKGPRYFINPIFAGDYPDQSLLS